MSTSSTTDSATSSSLLIPLTHIHHLITIKLTRENYLLWKAQIVPYLKGQHLYGFLDGSRPTPTPATASAATPVLPDSDLQAWHTQDQMILSALISSLSETVLAHLSIVAHLAKSGSALRKCSLLNPERVRCNSIIRSPP
jgi:hypothetical protein